MAAVLLLTHRPAFEIAWSAPLQRQQLSARPLPLTATRDALGPGLGLLVDVDSLDYSEAALLSCLALARARNTVAAIALGSRPLGRLDDLFRELCCGLVARDERDIELLAGAFARRLDLARGARIAHVGSLGSDELIVVFDDARVVLLSRPWCAADTGASVERVALNDGATAAQVFLQDGQSFDLKASELHSTESSLPPPGPGAGSLGDVDGVRLGQRLRALRIAAGLTQAELARRTGIHRPNIARVEAGRHTPSLETLARLAAAIGVSTTRVLSD